jgi:hexosaminidase
MMAILKKLGKDTVTWDSTFETGMTLPPGAVVHDYQGGTLSVAKIAKAGVRVISSSLGGDYVASQSSWASIFVEELMPIGLTPAEQKNILGGAAAMWGETMDDSDIDTIVWPDTAAVAERLWSQPKSINPTALDVDAATLRLIPHRCRLYQRGIRAKPLDDRDGFGRRRLQAQCETLLPLATAASLPPLTYINEEL